MKTAYGSISGSVHKRLEYNNQDFVMVTQNEDCIIGLIADGCGSGSNSEVGAQLSLNFISKWLQENSDENDWGVHLKKDIQNYSLALSKTHSSEPRQFIKDYLLYTILGFIVRDDIITVFSFGDGVIIMGNEIKIIDQSNRPKYINNELLGDEGGSFEFYDFGLKDQILVLGSDGLLDLIDGIGKGLVDEYRTLDDFTEDNRHFTNPVHLPKLLQKYSNTGQIKDDCSVIILKIT